MFWEGSSYILVKRGIRKGFLVFISEDIFIEIRKVLLRDFNLNLQEIEDIIYAISLFTNIIKPYEKVNIVKDDPDDNPIIECALACGADYIITQDKHLLKLKEYKDIMIIHPDLFLSINI